jgi:hypothetical protein
MSLCPELSKDGFGLFCWGHGWASSGRLRRFAPLRHPLTHSLRSRYRVPGGALTNHRMKEGTNERSEGRKYGMLPITPSADGRDIAGNHKCQALAAGACKLQLLLISNSFMPLGSIACESPLVTCTPSNEAFP